MRAISPAHAAVIKGKLHAGATGHRTKVLATRRFPEGAVITAPEDTVLECLFPASAVMPSGQACLVFTAKANAGAQRSVWFKRYRTEHQTLAAVEVFDTGYDWGYAQPFTWKGSLYVVSRQISSGELYFRKSTNNGKTWTAAAPLLPGLVLGTPGASANRSIQVQITPSRDGNILHLFHGVTGQQITYRTTTNVDPSTGWSAAAPLGTGVVTPSWAWNYTEGSEAATPLLFSLVETNAPGRWLLHCAVADLPSNSRKTQYGLLSGPWSAALTHGGGYGGGLSGGAHALSAAFSDRDGHIVISYVEHSGNWLDTKKSTDSGQTFQAAVREWSGAAYSVGVATGRTVSAYAEKEYLWYASRADGKIRVTAVGGPLDDSKIIVGPGSQVVVVQEVGPGGAEATYDLSARVISLSIDRGGLEAGGFSLVLENNDGKLDPFDANAEEIRYAVMPETKIETWEFYGSSAEQVMTFTGYIDRCVPSAVDRRVTVDGRDVARRLLNQQILTSAPQGALEAGAVRTTANGCYINKFFWEVAEHLCTYWGKLDLADVIVPHGSFVFQEITYPDGTSVADALTRACTAAGARWYADAEGKIRVEALGTAKSSVWTFKGTDQIVRLDPELSSDGVKTRVRIVGRANLGQKYLAVQTLFSATGAPVGIAFDDDTGHVWVLDASGTLYRLDPAASFAAAQTISGLPANATGLCVDDDGDLWIASGTTHRKISRANGALLAGPFNNPDGVACGIEQQYDAAKLVLVTRGTSPVRIVSMDKSGAELSRVNGPVNNALSITRDAQGGWLISAADESDLFQTDQAGNLIGRINTPAKGSADLGVQDGDLGCWVVWKDTNVLAKFVVTEPSAGAETTTLAEAVDEAQELALGEVRTARIVDMSITDRARAEYLAQRYLESLGQLQEAVSIGTVGHPGLELWDRVQVEAPGSSIPAGDYVISTIRSDHDGQTWLMQLVLRPYVTSTGI